MGGFEDDEKKKLNFLNKVKFLFWSFYFLI